MHSGWGVFAGVDVRAGQFVCEYAGELLTESEADLVVAEENDFLFQISNDYTIDPRRRGNVAAFVNHSIQPNCFMQRVYGKTYSRRLWPSMHKD
eukprot:SAG31_NODE_2339_length_5920_cov_15.209414_3_plen_94_part_00